MNVHEKFGLINKILRELADLKNSQVALIEKVSRLQIDNMELNHKELDDKLGDIHSRISANLDLVTEAEMEFEEYRDKFEKENDLSQPPEEEQ